LRTKEDLDTLPLQTYKADGDGGDTKSVYKKTDIHKSN